MAIGANRALSTADFLKAVAANVGNLLEGQIHQVFTRICDQLFQLGVIDRDQRIELSAAIGESLDALHGVIEKQGLDKLELSAEAIESLTGMAPLGVQKPEPAEGEEEPVAAPPPGSEQRRPAPAQAPPPPPAAPAQRALNLDETMVIPGGGLKTMGNGRVGGYLVVWSPHGERDLGGDYFDRRTDLAWAGQETRSVLYHHGLDPTMGKKTLGTGWELQRVDDVGAWVETQLDLRDQYEKALYTLVDQGKMGLSSGTAAHMIIRENDGHLARWPVVEGSFTPTPMEPRTNAVPLRSVQAVPLKALLSQLKGGIGGAPDTRGPRNTRSRRGGGGFGRWFRRNRRRLTEVKAMTVEELIQTLTELVPELNEDQLQQISAILRLGMGEPVEAMAGDEGMTEEMMAYFGAGGSYIDPWKAAADLDSILETIQSVVQLDDEKLQKITAILQLALQSAAGAEEEVLPEGDFEDVVGPEEGAVMEGEVVTDGEIRSIVTRAVQGAMGGGGSDFGRRTRVSRPPYQFNPADGRREGMSAGKAATMLRYGQPDAAVRAIATDLYGSNYEELRFNQYKGFGQFLRHGDKAVTGDVARAMKTMILTPSQLKAYALSGMDLSAMKTEMSEVIDQLGGWTVPEDFRTDMIERLPGLTVVRRRADVLQTGSDMMSRVKVTGGGDRYTSAVRVTWVGDVITAGDADTNPTFGVERTPIHITKATVYVPMALLEDTPFPLIEKINQWVSEAYGLDEDEQFLIGNGIAKPEGILPGSSNGNSLGEVVTGKAETISFDGLIGMRYGIARQYRNGAVWTMNDATAAVTAKLKDGDGNYMWQVSNQEGEPDRLLGYPVETSEAMPDIAAAAYPILFGNYNRGYQIADRIGMSVVRDDITKAEEDLVKFVFRRRLGGQLKAEWAFSAQLVGTGE